MKDKPSIEIEFGPEGQVRVEVISILEDLREDFLFFVSQAEQIDTLEDDLAVKRYCRAALLSFYAFMEGAMNLILLRSKQSITRRMTFFQKLNRIDTLTRTKNSAMFSKGRLADFRKLRNEIEHWKPGSDLRIFDSLTPANLRELISLFESWIRSLSREFHIILDYDSRDIHEELRCGVQRLGVETSLISESKHPERPWKRGLIQNS